MNDQPKSDGDGMPRWVKITGVITLLLALVISAVLLVGGDHGPGRHSSGGVDKPPPTFSTSHP